MGKPSLDRPRCSGKTAKGKPCKLYAVAGLDRCTVHMRSAAGMSRVKAGRPDGITENKVAEFERLISAGNYVETACGVLGVARSTYNEWMQKGLRDGPQFGQYRAFRQRMEVAKAKAEARHVANISKAAFVDGDAKMSAWFLERTAPERWARPSQRGHAAAAVPAAPEDAAPSSGLATLLQAAGQGAAPRNQG